MDNNILLVVPQVSGPTIATTSIHGNLVNPPGNSGFYHAFLAGNNRNTWDFLLAI
jgi:hypothetical protein